MQTDGFNMISVAIPVVHGRMLRAVLDSVVASSYSDFEIIVNDASDSRTEGVVREALKGYDVHLLPARVNLLQSRVLTSRVARGNHILMLDETRTIRKDLLQRLAASESDMAFIGEREVGQRPWAKWAEIDRQAMRQLTLSDLDPAQQLYCLPRYYETRLINDAYARITRALGPARFSATSSMDLEMPFMEAYPFARRPFLLLEPMIFHTADERLTGFVRKYFKYGRGAKMLVGTPYERLAKPRAHTRKAEHISGWDRMRLRLMLLLRGVPYAMGFYL
jgi:glycosyltransferase involved in cell wall biosynthesis